jgi:hypothetical protein
MTAPEPPLGSVSRLNNRLNAIRRKRFVGRKTELELFRAALHEAEFPFVVLHLFGPGGIGKSSLLSQYATIASDLGLPCYVLDGHNLEASPAGFWFGLQMALRLDETGSPLEALATVGRYVLLIDTYETLAALDSWLRDTFLPQLPGQALVVIAGRNPPAPAWYTDLGWQELVRVVSLRNFRPEESLAYLTGRGVASNQVTAALEFTHGHPLALSLVADLLAQAGTQANFSPENAPDVVGVLLERFLEQLPDPLQRQALEVSALVRTTTEALLGEVLPEADSQLLFTWLRSLSFMEQGPYGLFPHDLAREVIEADLRWRNPQTYRLLRGQVFDYLRRQTGHTRGMEQQRFHLDLIYALRHTPYMKRYLDWNSIGEAYSEPAKPQDFEAIVEMVRHHEGEASARIARHWLQRQPEAFIAYRDNRGELAGFLANLALHRAVPQDLEVDPAAKAALDYIAQRNPVRPGGEIVHHRFWMGRDSYKEISSALNMTVLNCILLWNTNRNLAWCFIVFAEPEFWQTHFAYLNFWRAFEADFETDGRRYGVFAHDWQAEPLRAWNEVMHQRQFLTDRDDGIFSPGQTTTLLVLSQTEFEEAVRQALRDYTRPTALAGNSLLRSRLVAENAASEAKVTALQERLRQAAESLKTNPKDEKLYRALWRTYFEPAATQERAAESLNLPFSTYRYHLTTGIERVTAWLWQRELYEPPTR